MVKQTAFIASVIIQFVEDNADPSLLPGIIPYTVCTKSQGCKSVYVIVTLNSTSFIADTWGNGSRGAVTLGSTFGVAAL